MGEAGLEANLSQAIQLQSSFRQWELEVRLLILNSSNSLAQVPKFTGHLLRTE